MTTSRLASTDCTVQNVLVPVDFGASSRAALDYALLLMERFDATLLVLHVWELPMYGSPELFVPSGRVVQSLNDQMQAHAEARMKELLAEAGALGNEKVRSRVIPGSPWVRILETAEEGKFDLVVMGTHGRTGLPRFFLGSVAERLVRYAPCPVMTVRGLEEIERVQAVAS